MILYLQQEKQRSILISKNTNTMNNSNSLMYSSFVSECRQALAKAYSKGGDLTYKSIIGEVLAKGRPFFTFSYAYAMKMMGVMLVHGKPCPAKGVRKEMWEEFADYVSEELRERNCKLSEAVGRVMLNKRASRYFISYDRAYRIFRYEEKRCHRCS